MPSKLKDSENVTARIGKDFSKELELIKEKRFELGKDKQKRSTRELTNIIVKHIAWDDIRKDTINLKIKTDFAESREVNNE